MYYVCLGTVSLRAILGSTRSQLKLTWGQMGPTWDRLGPNFLHLGAMLGGDSGAYLGSHEATLVPTWANQTAHGAGWDRIKGDLEPTWRQLGPTWCRFDQLWFVLTGCGSNLDHHVRYIGGHTRGIKHRSYLFVSDGLRRSIDG